jgi:hypothetical protein
MFIKLGKSKIYSQRNKYQCNNCNLTFEATDTMIDSINCCGYNLSKRSKNLSGNKYGKLTVIKPIGKYKNYPIFLVECDCKDKTKVAIVGYSLLKSNNGVTSCMCKNRHKDGMCLDNLVHIHKLIVDRCTNSNNFAYHNYGGRGINVFGPWLKKKGFKLFKTHIEFSIGKRPNDKMSLDRIDNDQGYIPGNLRWATSAEQIQNSRSSKLTKEQVMEIKLNKDNLSQKELSEQMGVQISTISRIKSNKRWSNVQCS